MALRCLMSTQQVMPGKTHHAPVTQGLQDSFWPLGSGTFSTTRRCTVSCLNLPGPAPHHVARQQVFSVLLASCKDHVITTHGFAFPTSLLEHQPHFFLTLWVRSWWVHQHQRGDGAGFLRDKPQQGFAVLERFQSFCFLDSVKAHLLKGPEGPTPGIQQTWVLGAGPAKNRTGVFQGNHLVNFRPSRSTCSCRLRQGLMWFNLASTARVRWLQHHLAKQTGFCQMLESPEITVSKPAGTRKSTLLRTTPLAVEQVIPCPAIRSLAGSHCCITHFQHPHTCSPQASKNLGQNFHLVGTAQGASRKFHLRRKRTVWNSIQLQVHDFRAAHRQVRHQATMFQLVHFLATGLQKTRFP